MTSPISLSIVDMQALFASSVPIAVTKRPGSVPVEFAKANGICATREGSVHYAAGDAILTGVEGETWPVARERFRNCFAPEGEFEFGRDGRYVRLNSESRAVQLVAPTEIPFGNDGDHLTGQAGDWILAYADGGFAIVADSIFRETYKSPTTPQT